VCRPVDHRQLLGLQVIVSIIWGLLASAAMIVMPIYEARKGISTTVANMVACRKVEAEIPEDVAMSKHGTDPSTKPAAKEEV
jgi:hypothetical protein